MHNPQQQMCVFSELVTTDFNMVQCKVDDLANGKLTDFLLQFSLADLDSLLGQDELASSSIVHFPASTTESSHVAQNPSKMELQNVQQDLGLNCYFHLRL